jgi:hypothetical protein
MSLPHVADHEEKVVYVHVPGGYPTTMGVPMWAAKHYPGYSVRLVNYTLFEELQNE